MFHTSNIQFQQGGLDSKTFKTTTYTDLAPTSNFQPDTDIAMYMHREGGNDTFLYIIDNLGSIVDAIQGSNSELHTIFTPRKCRLEILRNS